MLSKLGKNKCCRRQRVIKYYDTGRKFGKRDGRRKLLKLITQLTATFINILVPNDLPGIPINVDSIHLNYLQQCSVNKSVLLKVTLLTHALI